MGKHYATVCTYLLPPPASNPLVVCRMNGFFSDKQGFATIHHALVAATPMQETTPATAFFLPRPRRANRT